MKKILKKKSPRLNNLSFYYKVLSVYFFLVIGYADVGLQAVGDNIKYYLEGLSVQVSQSSKLAIGEQPNLPFPLESSDSTIYRINENIFDIGLSYGKFYFYTQLEYSESPIFGVKRTSSANAFNKSYLQYIGDNLEFKLGDIYSLYTRGLIFNTYQDQSTDFDNSFPGLELKYKMFDNKLNFYWIQSGLQFEMIDIGRYEFRTNPTNQTNDLYFDYALIFGGIELMPIEDFIINLQYKKQENFISSDVKTDGGQSIIEYYSILPTILGHDISDNLGDLINNSHMINSDMIGISLQGYALGLDIYLEYVANNYSKIGVQNIIEHGNMFYGSAAMDVFNIGVSYEHKRYDMPYYVPTTSFAPIVYREATSVLASRVSHQMNFVNETGHQFDILYPVTDDIMLNINLSTARRIHPFSGTENSFALEYDETAFNPINPEDVNNYFSWEQSSKSYDYASSPSFMSLLFMDQDENVLSFWPYRQLYVGLDGYLGKLSYNLGFDVFDHIKEWGEGQNTGFSTNYYSSNYTYIDTLIENISNNIDEYWTSYLSTQLVDLIDTQELNNYLDYYNEQFTGLCEQLYDDPQSCAESLLAIESSNEYNSLYELQLAIENADLYNNQIDSLNAVNTSNVNAQNTLSQQEAQDSIQNYVDNLSVNFPSGYQWHYTSQKAFTIPTQFSWTFDNGNSLLLYLEKQWREIDTNSDKIHNDGTAYDQLGSSIEKSDEIYVSLSYKNKRNTITLYHNKEVYEETSYELSPLDVIRTNIDTKSKSWNGIEWTVKIHDKNVHDKYSITNLLLSNSRISLFYGSQRGGLICANGVCAQQPEFSNGIKVSLTRIF